MKGIRDAIEHLYDIPKQLKSTVVFDQSAFVKEAIKTLLHEGVIGLALTSLMILIFLGSFRATSAVFLSIPLSALATFVVLYMMGSTINTMILGGLALAFSRIIDNSVISLENIYRHLEHGRRAHGRCGGGRFGSEPRGAGCNSDHSRGLLPGDISLRRQQVFVLRAGARGRDFPLRVVCRSHDRDSAVLLTISEGSAACQFGASRGEQITKMKPTCSGR